MNLNELKNIGTYIHYYAYSKDRTLNKQIKIVIRSNCDKTTVVLSLNEPGFPSRERCFHSLEHVLSNKQQ